VDRLLRGRVARRQIALAIGGLLIVGIVVVVVVASRSTSKQGGGAGSGSQVVATAGSGSATHEIAVTPPPPPPPPPVDAAVATPPPIDAAAAPPVVDAQEKTVAHAEHKAKKGHLSVRAFPVLTVYVDNRKIHDTPLDMDLQVGKHVLRLVNTDKGTDETVPITISDTKPTTIERM
jgi:hypothetical protein